MSKNVGSIDRFVRVVVGAALLVAFFMMPEAGYRWVLLIGIVPLITGLMGSCPAYSLLGISTCPMKR
ncbi:YgaP family membrane protein [Roseovarius sp. ZX-A-9]|uniref:YgaP family membrane protein n=1 Tax=Roseovarius sp. ZX-A-9 TaxID=3014783 RepID=UPI00232B9D4C|nr:DUF2892 domain-containing protein [Roseovarius sp. ZX-A-9]